MAKPSSARQEPGWVCSASCLLICGSLPVLVIGAIWQPWLMMGVVPVALIASHRADVAAGRRGMTGTLRELAKSWRRPLPHQTNKRPPKRPLV